MILLPARLSSNPSVNKVQRDLAAAKVSVMVTGVQKILRQLRKLTDQPLVLFLIANYLEWPAPAWKLRGYASIRVAGRECKFSTRGLNTPIGHLKAVARGRWEPQFLRVLPRILEHCGNAFDIGAWIGTYTLPFGSWLQPDGQVIAFEPDPIAWQQLSTNIALNRLENVTILPHAVSDTNGVCTLSAPQFGQSISRLGKSESHSDTLNVKTVRLDDFCGDCGVWPDLLKIDVEGAEDKVIEGGRVAISKAKCVALEFHPEHYPNAEATLEELRASLRDVGLKVEEVTAREISSSARDARHIVAVNPSLYSEIAPLL